MAANGPPALALLPPEERPRFGFLSARGRLWTEVAHTGVSAREHLTALVGDKLRRMGGTSKGPKLRSYLTSTWQEHSLFPFRSLGTLVERLWDDTRYFKDEMKNLGFDTGKSMTSITPVMLGEAKLAQEFSRRLFEEGCSRRPSASLPCPEGWSAFGSCSRLYAVSGKEKRLTSRITIRTGQPFCKRLFVKHRSLD